MFGARNGPAKRNAFFFFLIACCVFFAIGYTAEKKAAADKKAASSEKKAVATVTKNIWDEKNIVEKKNISVTGIVESVEEDGAGLAKSIGIGVINDLDEYEFFGIEKKVKGLELLKLVGETVQISGVLMIDIIGNKMISVNTYSIVKEQFEE